MSRSNNQLFPSGTICVLLQTFFWNEQHEKGLVFLNEDCKRDVVVSEELLR